MRGERRALWNSRVRLAANEEELGGEIHHLQDCVSHLGFEKLDSFGFEGPLRKWRRRPSEILMNLS